MSYEIVVLERRLGKVEVAVLEPIEHPQRGAPVSPSVTEVDHHGRVVAEEPPSLSDAADQLIVANQISEKHLHLDRPKPGLERPLRQHRDHIHHLIDRAPCDGSRP
jgi:hypothetical protein